MKTILGGSNYVTIGGDTKRPLIGAYHQNREAVAQDLADMRASGQNAVTFLLWHLPITWNSELELWGHTCNSIDGALKPQQQENLAALVNLVREAGFKQLNFRYGPQGTVNPFGWEEYSESETAANIAFMHATRAIIEANRGTLPVLYDLGGELFQQHKWDVKPWIKTYCINIWREYTSHYGWRDSCGFSCIGWLIIETAIKEFRSAKLQVPACFSIDVYSYVRDTLASAFDTLTRLGYQKRKIYVQECYYNDILHARQIKKARTEIIGLNLGGVFQWPLVRDSNNPATWVPDGSPKRFDKYAAVLSPSL